MKTAIILTIVFLALAVPSYGQDAYVYMSAGRGSCSMDGVDAWYYHDTYYIVAHSTDVNDANAVSFRLESDIYGPEDIVSIIPALGVAIESGDLFSGMRVSVPNGPLDHTRLLTINVAMNDPQPTGSFTVAWTRDVAMHGPNGDASLVDVQFFLSHCHGSGGSFQWMHPDTVEVPVGTSTVIDVRVLGHSGGGNSGTNLEASDSLGWLTDCSDCFASIWCGACPWHVQTVGLHITVPTTVVGGAVSEVHVTPTSACCTGRGTQLFVKAIGVLPIEQRSWSGIKALFR